MNNLFDNILVSSPNGGGLFFLHNGNVFKLDNFDTTGLSVKGKKVLRGIQPSALQFYNTDSFEITERTVSFDDIHDVYLDDEIVYLVGTSANEIIKLNNCGKELQRWVFSGEKDSLHINCLTIWNGRIVFSAFGEFTEHRGYKGKTEKSGFVQDLYTGKRIITGLSQPHSLVPFGSNLLLANSENKELAEYGPSGELVRTLTLDSYTRGICVVNNTIYVGLSCSRNIESLGNSTASVVALDRDSLKELGRIHLPVAEIYAIQGITNNDDVIHVLAKITSYSSARLASAVADRDGQIVSLNQVVAVRAGQIASLNQAVADSDGQIANLNQNMSQCESRNIADKNYIVELEGAVYALRSQVEIMVRSRSWQLTKSLRWMCAATYRTQKALFGAVVSSYLALSITPLKKQKLKDGVFRFLGFAFKNLDIYKIWKESQDIQTNGIVPTTPEIQVEDRSIAPMINPSLLDANGLWEWQDYLPVKAKITKVKAERLQNAVLIPFEMFNIKETELWSVAADLKLPTLVATPDVSIILPVFNNIKLTLECLLSIAQHADPVLTFEVIIADDASTDETADIIQSIANIRYTRNETNLGFLRNCNRALGEVNGAYVLYLNNDVQVTAGWLGALLATFESHKNVGAVGPRFVYPSGYLQEAGAAFMPDGMSAMIGTNEDPALPRYSYIRRVDYVSGACLLLSTALAKSIGGFSEEFLPCYCEDADLCLSVRDAGYDIYYNPAATIIHHLSKTTASVNNDFKMRCVNKNFATLQKKWSEPLDRSMIPRLITFYLPQYHPVPENDYWWGKGFTEWANVSKAEPNFVGHYQPRIPADMGYYDLRLIEVMQQQAELAQRYGVHGFCFYYYWFNGKRLLERPVEQLLLSDKPDLPFCLCWANENWTRRWDGQEHEVLMAQLHTVDDDKAVINDLIRFFHDARYIKIDGRPLILIYRVTLFPNFAETAARWRVICREEGIGEIYIAMVESFELVHSNIHPSVFGCDAAVEFPPHGLAEHKEPTGEILNPDFAGSVADYNDLAVRYATREAPAYTRFKGVIPGWDNTARRQHNSFCFENSTPGAFQGWLEEAIEETRMQNYGDERIVFVNAWNEWAEGAYLEPDSRFGHTYLEAVKNAMDASRLIDKNGIDGLNCL